MPNGQLAGITLYSASAAAAASSSSTAAAAACAAGAADGGIVGRGRRVSADDGVSVAAQGRRHRLQGLDA